MTVDLEWAAGDVFIAILDHNDVIASLRSRVGDVVIVATLMTNIDTFARSTRSVNGHKEHVVT